MSRSGLSRRGQRAAETNTSGQGPRPGLPSVRPPSRQARRPAGRLSSARAQRDSAPARSRSLGPLRSAPLGRDLPERSPRQTRRCTRARTHTLTHTHKHTQCPAQRPLRLAGSRFPCAQRDPLLPAPRGGWVTSPRRRAAEGKGEAARVPWAAGAGLVPGHGESRRLGVAGQGAGPAGGWVRARRRRRERAESGGGTRRSAAGTEPTVPSPHAPPAPPPPPRGARQVRSSPAPDPSLSRPPGSLFLPCLLPFPRSGRLRFLPRLSLKLRRSASSQNNEGRGGGDAGREGAGVGGSGSPRGTLGSVVREAGAGSSAAGRRLRPEPPEDSSPGKARRPREGGVAAARAPGGARNVHSLSLGFAILAWPSVSSEFVLVHEIRSLVGWGNSLLDILQRHNCREGDLCALESR